MSIWYPVAILPNLRTRGSIEGDLVALASCHDPRACAFSAEQPKLHEFLSRFTNAFHVPVEPAVLIVHKDVIPALPPTALVSFRDLVALCVVPYARSLNLVYNARNKIVYSDTFWLYPWMLDSAKKAYADLKGRMAKHGRSPEQLSVLPGVMPIIGASDAEAKEKLNRLQSWLTPTNALTLVTGRIGYDVSGYPLDGPVPPPPSEGGRTFHGVLYDMARWQNMTLRDLYNLTAAARGHWVICGTPTGIADTLEAWFVEGAADGYNILPAYFPGAFAEFVDLVVPELQHRGLFRRDYEGQTLRDHLGLPRLAAPVPLRQAAGAE